MRRLGRANQGSKGDDVSFHLLYRSPQTLACCASSDLVFGPYLLCSFRDLLPSTSRDHGDGSGILERESFRFRKMSMFWNLQDLLHQVVQAAPDQQVILTVSEATSVKASTSIAVVEAAPEVAKTNRFYNRLTNTGLQAFSLMHILESRGLRNAITMTYSNSKSHFFGPF